MIYIAIIVSFLMFFFCIEIIKRKYSIPTEISRKVIHIGSGFGALYWAKYISQFEFMIACSTFIILFLGLRKRRLLTALYPETWKTYGEITYVVGLMVLAFFYYENPHIFLLGVLIMMIPDSLAGLVHHFIDKPYRKHYHMMFYFISTAIIVYFFLPVFSILPFVIVLTLTEYYSGYGLDNLTVPVAFVVLMSLLF